MHINKWQQVYLGVASGTLGFMCWALWSMPWAHAIQGAQNLAREVKRQRCIQLTKSQRMELSDMVKEDAMKQNVLKSTPWTGEPWIKEGGMVLEGTGHGVHNHAAKVRK